MENAPFALAGNIPAASSLDRTPRKAWNMGKPRPIGETPKDHRAVMEVLAETTTVHDRPPLPSSITLRVKADRRRVQLPIPPGLDRRRPR